MSINIKKEDQSYDAIVVGTGISGGWATNYDKIPGKYEGCIDIDKYGGKVWAT
tara:strand:- start:1113 stop:1271 length:159 start_codon:yes stop_codon:yes gene_type:complete